MSKLAEMKVFSPGSIIWPRRDGLLASEIGRAIGANEHAGTFSKFLGYGLCSFSPMD